jgi:adenylate kinase
VNVVLFGPPGSGKGTQAKDLAARLVVPHVATGDIFRKHLKEGTELGLLAKSYMEQGGLVPDSVTCDLVGWRLSEPDASGGVLFDGFPRSVAQAEWLVHWLRGHGRRVDAVVNLVVPDELILERMSGRRTCKSCGEPYHVAYNWPAGGVCTKCGSTDIVQRPDDAESVVRDRLVVYAEQTVPCLRVLGAVATVHDVDGVGDIAVIKRRIFDALNLG